MSRSGPILNVGDSPELLQARDALSEALSRLDFHGIQWDSFKLEVMMTPLAEPFEDSRNSFVFPAGCTPLQIIFAINDSATLSSLSAVLLENLEKDVSYTNEPSTGHEPPISIMQARVQALRRNRNAQAVQRSLYIKNFSDQITAPAARALRDQHLTFVQEAIEGMRACIEKISSVEYRKALGLTIPRGVEQKPLPPDFIQDIFEGFPRLQRRIPWGVLRIVFGRGQNEFNFDSNRAFLENPQGFFYLDKEVCPEYKGAYTGKNIDSYVQLKYGLYSFADPEGLKNHDMERGTVANIRWISEAFEREYNATHEFVLGFIETVDSLLNEVENTTPQRKF